MTKTEWVKFDFEKKTIETKNKDKEIEITSVTENAINMMISFSKSIEQIAKEYSKNLSEEK